MQSKHLRTFKSLYIEMHSTKKARMKELCSAVLCSAVLCSAHVQHTCIYIHYLAVFQPRTKLKTVKHYL